MKNEQRERLVELLYKINDTICSDLLSYEREEVADYLLQNGVVVEKHGKWKYLPETINTVSCFECSNCKSVYDVGLDVGNTRYCPYCGARMDGE